MRKVFQLFVESWTNNIVMYKSIYMVWIKNGFDSRKFVPVWIMRRTADKRGSVEYFLLETPKYLGWLLFRLKNFLKSRLDLPTHEDDYTIKNSIHLTSRCTSLSDLISESLWGLRENHGAQVGIPINTFQKISIFFKNWKFFLNPLTHSWESLGAIDFGMKNC